MGLLSRFFNRDQESAAERAEWLNSAVQSVGQTVLNRQMAELRTAQRSFETAETPAWTDSWSTTAASLNDDLARQLPTLQSRSLGLARNNEWAARYQVLMEDNILGAGGIRLQMRLKKPDGSRDKDASQILESRWDDFCQRGNCEVSKRLTWREVEALALSTLERTGELLYRWRPGKGKYGIQIQMLNPALLDQALHREWGSNRIRQGKEINDDGEVVAYWLLMSKAGDGPSAYTSVGRHTRIPADEIGHYYIVDEVDQLRGIPWLTVGARRLWLTHDFEESAAVASSNAAKRQGFFFSPNGDAPPGFADTIVSSVLDAAKAAGKVLTPDEIQAITAAAEKYATTVPGQFDTLPQGYQFQAFESVWPNINADTYIKQQVRGWAGSKGISYVTMGNDLEAVNFSSAQVGIVGERDHYKVLQEKLISWLHRDVINRVMPYLVLADRRLSASRIEEYKQAATWQPRRWEPLDPTRAANANETNLSTRLTSRRRIAAERGDDFDELAEEIAEEEKIYGPVIPKNTPQPAPQSKAGKKDEEAD